MDEPNIVALVEVIMDRRTRFRYIIWPRITEPFRAFGRILIRFFTIYRVALMLVGLGIGIWYFAQISLEELLPNIVPELLSIALTILIIDTIYQHRSDTELKKVLLAQLGSKNNAVASHALMELKARGWLSDGTLRRAFLMSANLDGNSLSGADMRRALLTFASLRDTTWFETDLEGASLDHTDLRDATLSMNATGPHFAEANLKDANLQYADLLQATVRDEQLIRVLSLWRAKMPDGKLYDGRYNLPWDIELHTKSARDINDPQEWAFFYKVSLEEYLRGQEWAKENAELFDHR